jgi:iron complex outermembrane receptor protein
VEGFVNYGACPSPLCTAHGADGYISSYSLGELTTANKNIKPERSDSFTFGTVVEPTKGLSASLDYYYIKKNNLITGPNQSQAMAQYANSGTLPAGYSAVYDNLDSAFPGAAPRIVTIIGAYTNAASEYTDGVDLDLRGQLDMAAAGKFTSDLSVTKIISFVYEQAGEPNLQYVGYQSPYNLSSGAGTPQWRGKWTNSWTDGPLTVSALVYYVSGYKMYGQDLTGVSSTNTVQYICETQAFLGWPTAGGQGCHVASFTDTDITGSYQITKQLSISGAIQNVFDIKPPYDPSNYAGISYNPTYSQAGIVGRFFRVGVHFTL